MARVGPAMPLTPHSRLGPYEILSPLGAGGMGEVYRARDTRLDRDVAIKILPANFSADPERLRRFDQEARAAGQLNHPNVLTVHDLGTHEGSPYLVTELIEGRTVRERLLAGPISVPDVVEFAAQIARGLAAAHEKGIAHRDLKPENLLVTGDGRLKILDFGLAKLSLPHPADCNITAAPTIATATEPGVVMGTMNYMSPEQVRGRPADLRSDLFSFGTILHEMLTGRKAFQRETAAETMTSILRDEPAGLEAAGRKVPTALARLVRRCLEKAPEKRPSSARDLVVELEAIHKRGAASTGPAAAKYVAGGIVVASAVALGLAFLLRARPEGERSQIPALRLSQVTIAEGIEDFAAFSPDSAQLAYASESGGIRHIVRKDLRTGKEDPLTRGDCDEIQPAWMADGETLLFVRARQSGRRLEPSDIFGEYTGGDVWTRHLPSGREARLVENAFNPAPSPDGAWIAVDAAWLGPSRIWLVDRQGHNPQQITTDTSEAVTHLRPRWSSDGKKIVFQNLERTKFDIRAVDVGSKTMTWVTDDPFKDVAPAWDPSGRFIYFSSFRSGGMNLWRIPVNANGGPAGRPQQITSGAGQDVNLTISADGRRIAFSILGQNADIWKLPVSPASGHPTGPPQEVIATTREESRGAWSPDGHRVAFNSDRASDMNIWLYDDRDQSTRQLTRGPGGDYQPNWSPDGSRLVFFSSRSGNADLWTVEIASGKTRQITRDRAMEIDPFYAPDGRTIAYQSDAGGRLEVWIASDEGSSQRMITSVGVTGHFLRWSRDGAFVTFLSTVRGNSQVMRVPASGGEPEALPPVAGGSHISFSPNGLRIMDVTGHKALWVSPLNGGQPEQVFEFDDPSVRIDYPVWSPDGAWVLFDRFSPKGGDIWLLEGF